MNDQPFLTDWMEATEIAPPDAAASAKSVRAKLRSDPEMQPGAMASGSNAAGAPTRWSARSVFASMAGAAVVVVFAGAALVALMNDPDSEGAEPAILAGASPTAAGVGVHWRTELVDLSADSVEIEVDGQTFTSGGARVAVHSDPGSVAYWTLEMDWFERGVEQRINLYFGSDGTDWWVDEIRTYDGHEDGRWVYAYGPFFRTPLGDAYQGNVAIPLLGEGRPGDASEIISGELGLAGLTLRVSPGERARPDPVAENRTQRGGGGDADIVTRALGWAQRQLGGITLPPAVQPFDRNRPSVDFEYGDMRLSGQPAGASVFRITGDGTGRYANDRGNDGRLEDVAITDDGTIWVARRGSMHRVGLPGSLAAADGGPGRITSLRRGPDGGVLVNGHPRTVADERRSVDVLGDPNGGWTVVPHEGAGADAMPRFATVDFAWAYFPNSGDVGQFVGDTWVVHTTEEIFPIASTIDSSNRSGARDRIVPVPDGTAWATTFESISRFDGETWQEYRLAGDGSVFGELTDRRQLGTLEPVVGPDGTVWISAWAGRRKDGERLLARFQDDSWSAFRLDDLATGRHQDTEIVAVDADGGVYLRIEERRPQRDVYVRFDGTSVLGLGTTSVSLDRHAATDDGRLWAVKRGARALFLIGQNTPVQGVVTPD